MAVITHDAATALRELLRNAMRREGLTMRGVAHDLSLAISMVDGVINARRSPSDSTFADLAKTLNLTAEERTRAFQLVEVLRARRDRRNAAADSGYPHITVDSGHATVMRTVADDVPQFGQPDPFRVENVVQLIAALRAVHVWAGKPSLRTLVARSQGRLKRSSISDMLRGEALPDYDRFTEFLRACGIRDVTAWVFTWRRLKALEDPTVAEWLPTPGPRSA
ncbi:helix-turn-helix transcriptional regulator [Streptomyces sp. BPTC-684]|uniref:helix-turn-helix domain-containing protein n=1 Tax=Streptomyces sp. BPTC-684 TaxID=3043734 RepID=UPI0024B11AB1|nr:helix-turn-helix transcriptional regulator [Streptomyces sp. BPTC-684]WHM41107.1 helix-turn-helix transcriptional regulator [Streptomyces sp. BPTC-684]